MATIKRNGDKVVIKDGKVACGCCCGCATPMGELRDIMRNITSSSQLTCNGEPPYFFYDDESVIVAEFEARAGIALIRAVITIYKTVDCFTVVGYHDILTLLQSGTVSENCPCDTNPEYKYTCSPTTFTINGIEKPAYTEVPYFETDFPGHLTFVIT